ncbi:MAG: response regulator transcription factor [Chloroflexaceae bacterium]|nr:response regulator transcription factor [Chloroflexaceae bacterium]
MATTSAITSVLMVDTNQHFLRIALHLFQEHYHEELTVVGIAPGGKEALEQARKTRPHIVLLDLDQHCLENLQLIALLRDILPDSGIIALGSHDLRDYYRAALAAGANVFVAKTDLNNRLLPAIRAITHPSSLQSRSIGRGQTR